MLDYIQIFADMAEDHFEVLTDEELGIIIRACMAYAFDGIEPDFELRSVLGLTWRRMKRYIDQCSAKNEHMSQIGKNGGNASASKRNQAEGKRSQAKGKRSQAEPSAANHNQDQEQEQDQDQDQEHTQDQEQEQWGTNARTRASTAAATADTMSGYVEGFNGEELTADVQRNHEAEALVAQYLPPSRTPIEYDPRVAEMASLLDKHGAEKVKGAIRTAVTADNRGGISIAFLAAILDDKGAKQPKGRAAPVDYQARQYSASEVSSMEVDLDAELDRMEAGR